MQTFNREEAERLARESIRKMDNRRMQEAEKKFLTKEGLEDAIKTDIFPALVTIKTRNGIRGTGFFQHSEWLVSNAHIIPCAEIIPYTNLVDNESNLFELNAEQSYHRPSEKDKVPDVVIIKTNSRRSDNRKCLQTQFSGDEDYSGRYTFYVDFNSSSVDNNPIVNFLNFLTSKDKYPLYYQTEDGDIPQPGSSGTPIIEARVILGREPKWQFKVVGILYARCSSPKGLPEDTKLVCAIPVIQEFSDVLEIIRAEEESIRLQQMAFASDSLGDTQGKMDSQKYQEMSLTSKRKMKLKLEKFENGVTELDISLPDDLEKLWYDFIVDIRDSLLIEEARNRVIRRNTENYRRMPLVSYKDLKEDFDNFIQVIRDTGELSLKKGKGDVPILTSPAGFFRLDLTGGGKKDWKLDIQDNTGGKKYEGKTLSSTFATVKIPKDINSIEGKELERMFLESQEKAITISYEKPNLSNKSHAKYKNSKGNKIQKKPGFFSPPNSTIQSSQGDFEGHLMTVSVFNDKQVEVKSASRDALIRFIETSGDSIKPYQFGNIEVKGSTYSILISITKSQDTNMLMEIIKKKIGLPKKIENEAVSFNGNVDNDHSDEENNSRFGYIQK